MLSAATTSPVEAEPPQPGDIAAWQQPDQTHVRFTIFTAHGFVGFTAEDHWPVIAMHSEMPVAVAAFQIPDEADNGTPDSTNLAITLAQADDERGKAALAHYDAEHQAAAASAHTFQGWTTYTYESSQGATMYTIIDARSVKADVTCEIRLAWPHLQGHTTDYNGHMEALLRAVLTSVDGGVGAYAPHEGEIVRRPTN